MRLESALAFKVTLGTARVYVNSADECHGSQTRIYNLFAHGRKKCATHVPCYVFFVGHCCVKQITFRFEKATSRQRKIYIMKKAIMLDTHLSLRFTYDDFFKTSKFPRLLSMRNRTKIYYFRLWKMSHYIHCNRRSLQCFIHRNVNSFVLHRT